MAISRTSTTAREAKHNGLQTERGRLHTHPARALRSLVKARALHGLPVVLEHARRQIAFARASEHSHDDFATALWPLGDLCCCHESSTRADAHLHKM